MSYCLRRRKNTESKYLKLARTKNGKIMLLRKCKVCDSEKTKFIKEQEASRLLSSITINTPLNKIPFIGPSFVLKAFRKFKQDIK